MKRTLTLVCMLVVVFAANATIWKLKKKDKQVEQIVELVQEPEFILANDIDSMSYALGVNIGTDLLNNLQTLPGGKYNLDVFLNAFSATMQGDSVAFTAEESGMFLQHYFTAAHERESMEQRAEGENFLKENLMNPAVQSTASGLQYIVLEEGEGASPVASDHVRVHYEGRLVDGTIFDSSYQRNQPAEFQLDQVISGWTEGVQLMTVGSKYRFFIPYDLGYGEQGASGVIPPYATLIFTVELLDILPSTFLDNIKELEINQ